MADYKERNALIEALIKILPSMESARAFADSIPNADVERHESWKMRGCAVTGEGLVRFYECTGCGHESTKLHNYCPDCGAKMNLKK